jgi:hypothetical protein
MDHSDGTVPKSIVRKLKPAILLPAARVLLVRLLLLWADRTPIAPPSFPIAWFLFRCPLLHRVEKIPHRLRSSVGLRDWAGHFPDRMR